MDVCVSGAGPVGCFFARCAAEKGLSVVVYEEHAKVGEPVQCSGLISKKGLDELGIDYSPAVLNSMFGARIRAPDGSMFSVGDGKVRAFVVDRTKLDSLLADAAEKQGAKLELGKKTDGQASGSGARALVGADGCTSAVAACNGFPKIREFVVGYQVDYENAKVQDADKLDLYLSNEKYPGFFAWLIPLGKDRARVGLGVSAAYAGRKNIKDRFQEFISGCKETREALDGARQVSTLAGCIPISMRERTVDGNKLLVGDAAGQVKATTGGGVVFGCRAARIAADCVVDFINDGKPLVSYEQKWRAELGSELSTHSKVRAFINGLSDGQIGSYIKTAKIFGAEGFLNRYGDMDDTAPMLKSLNGPLFYPLRKMAKVALGKK